jgi:hypothetical protein
MWDRTYKWLIISLIIIAILFSVIYNKYFNTHLNLLIINKSVTIDQTNIITNSSYIHPMFKDPEAKICYSLKSLSMPEQIINLNAIAVDRQQLHSSVAPTEVTFNKVHSILYGDPSSKLIYQYGQKYFNKTFDKSYPDTSLTRDIFNSIIEKIHPTLKVQFIVEVGSFTGNSASIMGDVLKNKYPGSFLLCVDTWLGGMEFHFD